MFCKYYCLLLVLYIYILESRDSSYFNKEHALLSACLLILFIVPYQEPQFRQLDRIRNVTPAEYLFTLIFKSVVAHR